MERRHWIALVPCVLVGLAALPAPAVGGYDIAHIVKRTCEPGGPLIVEDEWKSRGDRDRLITEPGEVIACPPAGPKESFQIGAGPEPIGREPHLCTYVSLLNGDGADICLATDSPVAAWVRPLMVLRVDQSDSLALVGIGSDQVASVETAAGTRGSPESAVIPIDGPRASRLGAASAFSYFSLPVDPATLCAGERVKVLGRNGSGQRIAEGAVPTWMRLLDAVDPAPYAGSLKAFCRSQVPSEPAETPSEPAEVGWLSELSRVLRSLLTVLI